LLGVAVVAAVGGLAAANGGYLSRAWNTVAIVLLWGVALGARLLPGIRWTRLDVVALASLTALVGWMALSVLWSLDPTQSLLEVQRALCYLAALAALLRFVDRSSVGSVLVALVVACVLVCCYALASWLVSEPTAAAGGLAAPIGYSSALGLLAAIGCLLGLAVCLQQQKVVGRALAAAALVPLASTLALAASRAVFVAFGVGLLTSWLLGPRSAGALRATARLLAVPALAAAVAADSALTGPPQMVALILLAAASAAVNAAPGTGRGGPRPRPAAVAIMVLLALGAAAWPRSGPEAEPPGVTSPAAQVLDRDRAASSLEARRQLWQVAWQGAGERPLLGWGAGSYARLWLLRRSTTNGARDAHNLYLETLAELGTLGLALLLLVLSAPLWAAVRARRQPLVRAAAGAYVAYLVHAGFHWDWELPALTLASLVCAAVLLAAARKEGQASYAPRGIRAVGITTALALSAAVYVAMLGNAALARSRTAAMAGVPSEAAAQARIAARWQPWSGEPWRLAGEAARARGDPLRARASFRQGVRRDRRSWRLWADLALVSRGAARAAAARRAAALNPLRKR
jgi:O-antigen ligase